MASTVSARDSLQLRITLSTLAIFLISILSLSFYLTRMLREEMQQTLGEQQFAAVSFAANGLNQELTDLFSMLEARVRHVSPAMLSNQTALQAFLEAQSLDVHFNSGAFITGTDGTAIASIPVSLGRIGVNYLDRDFMVAALKEGKATIGRPVVGKKTHTPIIVMATPIRDAQGKVIGALAGVIDLSKRNFLDKIAQNSYGRTGGYLLNAPKYRLIVTATDKSRIMQPLPAPGVNTMLDRYMTGYEGYGISINSIGIEELNAAKGIPVAGWFLGSVMPTEEAFAPIDKMQQRMLLVTLLLCLLATGLTWWMVRRQIAPIFSTLKILVTLSESAANRQPLPITRQDEIGQLIGGFNRLLETLKQRDTELRESEFRWKFAIDGSGDGLWDWNVPQSTVFFTSRWKEMLGFAPDEIGSGLDEWSKRIHPDDLVRVKVDVQAHLDGTTPLYINEHRVSCKDGSYKWILDRGVVVERDAADTPLRIIGTHTDITERKQVEAELEQHRNHLEDQVSARTRSLRRVSAQLTLTEERERRMLAQELHDNLSQLLAIIRIKLVPLAASEFQPAVKEIMALVDQADQSARMVTRQLSPPILNTMGLGPALEWLGDEMLTTHGLKVHIDCQADCQACTIALFHPMEALLFRSVRELLINVAKHAKASDAHITFQCDESHVTLVVSDEGCGFDSASFHDPLPGNYSFGLSSIYERIINIGGEVHVVSSPGHGASITLSVPRSIAVKEYQLP